MMVQGFWFRIYTKGDCIHCFNTKRLFDKYDIPYQEVIVDNLLKTAIPLVLRKPEIELPIIMNFMSEQLCVGYHVEQLEQWIQAYLTLHGNELRDNVREGQRSIKDIEGEIIDPKLVM